MKRWRNVARAGILLVTAGLLTNRYHLLHRIVRADGVATYELKRQPFERRVTADGYLRAVKATPLTAPAEAQGAQKIAWLALDGSAVKKDDVVIRFDPTELEKKLRDGQSDHDSAEAKIDKERVLVSSAMRSRTLTADMSSAELAAAKRFPTSDPEIFSRNQIVESAIDEGLSAARVDHANDAKTIEGALSASRIDLIRVEKKRVDLQVAQASRGLRGLEVRAPHDGILVFEVDWRGNIPHVGDSVWAGQKLATLPLMQEMEADVCVLEADAAGLVLGDPASVVLEAHPEVPFDAKIKRIDTLAKPRIREVPIQYFGATLELARTDQALMKPGERVHVTLVLDKKDALTVPRQCVFDKDGKKVVYRGKGKAFEPTPVKVGASTPGLVVIEEGIGEGDRVALRDPTRPLESVAASDSAEEPKAPAMGAK